MMLIGMLTFKLRPFQVKQLVTTVGISHVFTIIA